MSRSKEKRQTPPRLGGEPGTYRPGIDFVQALVETARYYVPAFRDNPPAGGERNAVLDGLRETYDLTEAEDEFLTAWIKKLPHNSDWPEYSTMLKILGRAVVYAISGAMSEKIDAEKVTQRLLAGPVGSVLDPDNVWPCTTVTPRKAAIWFLEKFTLFAIDVVSPPHAKLIDSVLYDPYQAGMITGSVYEQYRVRLDRNNTDLYYNGLVLEQWHKALSEQNKTKA